LNVDSQPSTAIKPCSELECSVEQHPFVTLEKFGEDWSLLAGRAIEPNVFLDPAFLLPFCKASGLNHTAVMIWSKGPSRQLLGFFPITIVRNHSSLPFPVLSIWAHSEALLGTPLVDRQNPERVINAFLDHVSGSAKLPKIIVLRHTPEMGLFMSSFARVLSKRGDRLAMYGRHERAYLAPMGSRASYLEFAIKAKRRHELQRLRRRLQDTGCVEVSTTKDAPMIGSALDDYLTLEASGWKGRAGTAIAPRRNLRGFVEASVASLAAKGTIRIDRLLVNSRAIAAAITLQSQDKAWYWKMSYDEAYGRFSPGTLLTLELTKLLLLDSTILSVDSSTKPDHPTLDHMWREHLAVGHCIAGIGSNAKELFDVAYRIEGFANSGSISWTVPR